MHSPLAAQQKQSRPSIIYMMANLGYGDQSCCGRKDDKTMNIDKLASEGIQFMNASATTPVCAFALEHPLGYSSSAFHHS